MREKLETAMQLLALANLDTSVSTRYGLRVDEILRRHESRPVATRPAAVLRGRRRDGRQ
jgi:hypothetical protein